MKNPITRNLITNFLRKETVNSPIKIESELSQSPYFGDDVIKERITCTFSAVHTYQSAHLAEARQNTLREFNRAVYGEIRDELLSMYGPIYAGDTLKILEKLDRLIRYCEGEDT